MPSTYSTSLRLELIGNGEQAGNWGNTNNINLGTLLEQAIAGVESVAISGTSYTLTTGNGVSDQARNAVIVLTGTLSANCNVIVPSVDKTYTFRNATTGGFSVVVKTAAGSGVTITNGYTQAVYCDATNVIASGVAYNSTTNDINGTNIISTGQFRAAAGTAAVPSMAFTGDPDTGIYNPSAGELAVSLNGSDAYRARASGVRHQFYGLDGATIHLISGTTRGVRITTDASSANIEGVDQTGVATYQPIALKGSELVFATGSSPAERLRISAAGQLQNSAGTAAAPAYSFSGDTDTGIYNAAPNAIGIALGGAQVASFESNQWIQIGNPAQTFTPFYILNAGASASQLRVLDFTALNENFVPLTTMRALVNTDGSGDIELYATPAGSRASERRVKRMTISGSGAISMVGPVNVTSGGQTVTGDLEASGNLRFNSGYGSAAIAYGVRAWVNFNGTGTVAIRASGGVTSITDNGTGDYTVNFNFTMPDANYGPQLTASKNKGSGDTVIAGYVSNDTPPSTTGFRFYVTAANFANSVMEDSVYMNVLVVR